MATLGGSGRGSAGMVWLGRLVVAGPDWHVESGFGLAGLGRLSSSLGGR
jgi:hypothetical protein